MSVEVLIPRKFKPFIEKKKRFKVALGGRGSAKSNTFADIMICDAMRGIKTACFREFQNSIDDSVHALLTGEIERLGFQGFDCQQTKILYNGEEVFKFRGLARNPEGVKSMYGFKRFWIEEGQTISFESLKALTPTLRTEDSEIWISANIRSLADPFSQRFFKPFERELRADGFYEDDLHYITWVNHDDNPMFPDVLEQERKHDHNSLSRALYAHIWEGEPYDEVENSIIPLEWFEAAIDAHEKLGFKGEGAIIAAHDPSDEGGDAKGYVLRHGAVVLDADEMVEGDVNVGCDWAVDKALAGGADWFVWDCDGLGVTLKRQVDHALAGKKVDYFMFKGSESPENQDDEYDPVDSTDPKKRKKNREAILNKRAQYYMRLAKRFHNTYRAVERGEYVNPDDMISLSSSIKKIDQLRSEVCRIPLKRNNSGKIQIMSKLEMSKKPYELPSPNMADSLMMAMGYAPIEKVVHQPIKFSGWNG